MTAYAPTDCTSIAVHPENGGCGEEHKAGLLEPGELFRLNCPQCEPVILRMRTGWAATPEGVALTPDEIGEAERAETNAKRQQNRTWGDPALIGDAIRDAMLGPGGRQQQAEPPSLLAQIAALAPEERAALAGMLMASNSGTTAVGSSSSAQLSIEPTQSGGGDEEGEPEPVAATLDGMPAAPLSTPVDNPVDTPVEPVRRGPGRPRTRT